MESWCGKRKVQASDGHYTKAKRRPRAGTQKRWMDGEVTSILEYMKRTILNNGEIEAPTASLYYEGLIKELQLQDVNAVKLKAKVTNLKTQYVRAMEWLRRTGQSLPMALTEDEGHLLKLCPHFYLLDEIYGREARALPSFTQEGGVPDTEVGFEVDEKVSSLVELIMADAVPLEEDDGAEESPKMVVQQPEDLPKVSKKVAYGGSVGLMAALAEAQNRRTDMLNLEHKLEMQRLEYEHTFRVQHLAFKERELALAEKKHETERELKILEMQKDERVAKFKIEQDVKLQLELKKLKS